MFNVWLEMEGAREGAREGADPNVFVKVKDLWAFLVGVVAVAGPTTIGPDAPAIGVRGTRVVVVMTTTTTPFPETFFGILA